MNGFRGESTSTISAAARLCLALLLAIPFALVMPLAPPEEALAADSGFVEACGANDFGQCDVPDPNSDFTAAAAGYYHSLGLKSDGSIVAWGNNDFDQCNVPAPNSGFVAVGAGYYHSLGVKADGSVVAWGNNGSNQCDVPAPNSDFTAAAGGARHSLGLKTDGTVVAWGDNFNGQCDVPAPNSDFTAVAAGRLHSLGLKSDGTVVAWGDNFNGQCDVPAPNSCFSEVAAGDSHSLGLKYNGTVVAWGRNDYGQCDVPDPNSGFVAVVAGYLHSLGLKADGTLVAWGDNTHGQCLLPYSPFDFTAVAAGGWHSLGLSVVAPVVTSIHPDQAVQGQTLDDVSINGGHFFYDVAINVRLVRGVDSIEGTDVTWVSRNQITCDFAIPGDAVAASDWDVCVRHGNDGKEGVLADAFSVVKPTVYAAVSGAGGQVDPASQSVSHGGTASVDIIPDTGFKIASITDNGAPAAIADPYVITNVTGDHTVEVAFEAETFSVDASVLAGSGILDPAHQTVGWDGTASIDITPETGYHTASITDNGSPVFVTSPYVIENVREDHEVIVTFALDAFTVTASAPGGNGTVDPPVQFLDYHSTASVDITPDPGYHIASITDNGAPVAIADPYVIQHVYEDHDVVVTFAIDTFDVEAAVYGGHGTVDPATQTVDWDGTASIAITPDPGYHIEGIFDNLVSQPISDTYVIENVQSDHAVIATFAIESYTITASADGSGTVTGAGNYDHGDMVNLNALPDTGWHFTGWTEGGSEVSTSAFYSFSATGPRNLTAHFAIDSFRIDVSVAGGNGSVDPATKTVDWGSTAAVAIAPDPGHHIDSITDNGTPMPVSNPYVIEDIQADHAVVVTFAEDASTWYLAEGATAGGMETWVLVANPNPDPVTVNVSFLTGEGLFAPNALQGFELGGESRVSFDAGAYIETYDLSTLVSSAGGEVVCERAMYGNSRTWAHDSIGVTASADTWYLAEGCTEGGMETFILLLNPGNSDVSADISFQTNAGEVAPPDLQGVTIPAFTRRTFRVNDYVTTWDVSAQVEADGPVIAERAMYGDSRTWAHGSIGVTEPSDTWYLAEGCTEGGMETWVLVQNPNANEVTVDLTFMTISGPMDGPQDFVIPAGSRASFNACSCVTDYDVSTVVTSEGGGIVCERAMYGGGRTWAHDSVGVTEPSDTWYLAEGCTDGGMETWVLVANPNAGEVSVDLTFMTASGPVDGPQDFVIPAGSRASFNACSCVTDYDVSTVITSEGGGIVCERAMYGGGRTFAHDSVGYAP